MTSIMEAPAVLENGDAPQNRKSTCLRVAFYALIFVLIIISALVPIVFCLLHHKQAPKSCWAHGYLSESSSQNSEDKNWDWKLEHCDGIVQDQGQYLVIEQSGTYFIYAQLFRQDTVKEPMTLMLYRHPEILLRKHLKIALNNAKGHGNGTVNFARPFFLEKGDGLSCEKNDSNDILLGGQTYWGLFKM